MSLSIGLPGVLCFSYYSFEYSQSFNKTNIKLLINFRFRFKCLQFFIVVNYNFLTKIIWGDSHHVYLITITLLASFSLLFTCYNLYIYTFDDYEVILHLAFSIIFTIQSVLGFLTNICNFTFTGKNETFFVMLFGVCIYICTRKRKIYEGQSDSITSDSTMFLYLNYLVYLIENNDSRVNEFKLLFLLNDTNKEGNENSSKMKYYNIVNYKYLSAFKRNDLGKTGNLLLISYGLFSLNKLKKYRKVYQEIDFGLNNELLEGYKHISNYEYYYGYCGYQLLEKKQEIINEKVKELNCENNYISYKYYYNELERNVKNTARMYSDFWRTLEQDLNRKSNIKAIIEYGNKLTLLIAQVKDNFNSIQEIKRNDMKSGRLFGCFWKNVLHDDLKSEAYIKGANQQAVSNDNSNGGFIDIINYSDNDTSNAIVISSKNKPNKFGDIGYVSKGIYKLFGFSDNYGIGRNISILFPNMLINDYMEMLENDFNEHFLNTLSGNKITGSKESMSNVKVNEVFYFHTKTKFLLPANVSISYFFDENYNPIIFINLNNLSSSVLTKSSYILTNKNLRIESVSSSVMNIMQLSMSIANNGVEITTGIKEFNELYLDILTKSLNNDHISAELKLEILMSSFSKNAKVTIGQQGTPMMGRKNQKNVFIGNIKQIKVCDQLNGYVFKFEKPEPNYNNEVSLVNNSTNTSYYSLGLAYRFKSNNSDKNNITLDDMRPLNVDKDFVPEFDSNHLQFYHNDNHDFGYEKHEEDEANQDKTNSKLRNTLKMMIKEKIIMFDKQSTSSNSDGSSSLSESKDNETDNSADIDPDADSTKNLEDSKEMSQGAKPSELPGVNPKNEYYKITFTNIHYYIYKFKDHKFEEIKNYKKASKMIDLLSETSKECRGKTCVISKDLNHPSGSTQRSNAKTKARTSKQSESDKDILENISSQKVKCNIYLITVSIIAITILAIVPVCLSIENTANNNNTLLKFGSRFTLLLLNVYEINHNMLQLILLNNEKYTNTYIDKEDYFELCIGKLNEIYLTQADLIMSIKDNELSIPKELTYNISQIIVPLSFITFNTSGTYNASIITALLETNANIFKFIHNDRSQFVQVDNNYGNIFSNSEKANIIGIKQITQLYQAFYMDEIQKIKYSVHVTYGVFLLANIIEIVGIILGTRYTKKQIYDNIDFLYSIHISSIKVMYGKGDDYAAQFEEESHIIQTDRMQDEEQESENNQLQNTGKDSEPLIPHNPPFMITKSRQSLRFNCADYTILIIYISFFIISGIAVILLVIYYNDYILSFSDSVICYTNISQLELKYSRIFLYVKYYILYGMLQVEYVGHKTPDRKVGEDGFHKIYELDSNLNFELAGYMDKYGRIGNTTEIYNSIYYSSGCPYLQKLEALKIIECNTFSDGIIKYGLGPVLSYFVSSSQTMAILVDKANDIAFESGLPFAEYAYGSFIYDLVMGEISDKEYYNSINPFNQINNDLMKQLDVLWNYIIRPCFENLKYGNAEAKYQKLYKYQSMNRIVIISYIIFVILLSIVVGIPKEVRVIRDGNNTLKLAKIIPQDIGTVSGNTNKTNSRKDLSQ